MSHVTTNAAEAATFAYYDGRPGGAVSHALSGTVIYRFPSGIAMIGKFTVNRGIITVTYGGKKKPTQLSGMGALALAEMLMGELVLEAA